MFNYPEFYFSPTVQCNARFLWKININTCYVDDLLAVDSIFFALNEINLEYCLEFPLTFFIFI